MPPRKILLVDDEPGQRRLLAGYLTREGYEVSEAENGEDALVVYQQLYSPVVMVDMKMPGMSGLELLGRLRELNPFVQVIVLTAFGSVETAVEAMRRGAYDYLTKPVEDLAELKVKLEKAATQNQLIRDNQVMAERLQETFPTTELIGESPAMKKIGELITMVAPQSATVLVTGPSGTGKELVARAIHALS
ncbi:MAG: sigma-54-dependent Fis family transcriptional regulator, partial [candidate division Zixibacteria bacterium]|nr:sigma-54-dependent Fis family transcriptional regulator [candidate division Zixibacteria bacterium]